MDLKVAEINYNLLMGLVSGQKLCVKSTGELVHDDRWMQGLRRRRDGVSREDILEPIKRTLNTRVEMGEDIGDLVRRLKVVFNGTYPDFMEIQSVLDDYLVPSREVLFEPVSNKVNECVSENVKSIEVYLDDELESDSNSPLNVERCDDLGSSSSISDVSSKVPGGLLARVLGFLCIKY